ncbi:hypothetical protein [Streptomyces sp.]|uniref:hypothetical protein n=1 Tax=Streptomyces sp. TaxID=1931 RepID=UPI002D793E44|nr:hypothetical protein [Streptomyces sp.]HET6354718.1 hypothetical protein [Streptomyces sp.]
MSVGGEVAAEPVVVVPVLSENGSSKALPEGRVAVAENDGVALDGGREGDGPVVGPESAGVGAHDGAEEDGAGEDGAEEDRAEENEAEEEVVGRLGVLVDATTGAAGRGSGVSCTAAMAPAAPSTHTAQAAAVARIRRCRRAPRASMRVTGTGAR